jgi:hypothetical protein
MMDKWIDENNKRRPSHQSTHPKTHRSTTLIVGLHPLFLPFMGL